MIADTFRKGEPERTEILITRGIYVCHTPGWSLTRETTMSADTKITAEWLDQYEAHATRALRDGNHYVNTDAQALLDLIAEVRRTRAQIDAMRGVMLSAHMQEVSMGAPTHIHEFAMNAETCLWCASLAATGGQP